MDPDVIAMLAAFDEESIEDYAVYMLLQEAVGERKLLYRAASFDIEHEENDTFRQLYRFDKEDVKTLHKALQMPHKFETPDRHVIGGIEGLCLVLRRFAHPHQLKDLQSQFGMQYSSINRLLKHICHFIYDKWGRLLLHFAENKWFTPDMQAEMAAKIHAKGAPLKNCIGFVGGTAQPTCRSETSEQNSGQSHTWRLKFQCVTLPNGLLLHMSLPYPDWRSDDFILEDTLLIDQLQLYCKGFCLYGDENYPLSVQLMRPYCDEELTAQQQQWNTKMSSFHECVERSFDKILKEFAFVDIEQNEKLLLQPIGMYYSVAGLLTNAHNCIYGNSTSTFFNVKCPGIFEYFQ